jgi:hypothetical protein
VYYEGLVSKCVPLSLILLVMTSHYVSCLPSTPFHPLMQVRPVINVTIVEEPTPVFHASDPVSFIYDSFMEFHHVSPVVPVVPVVDVVNVADHHSGLTQLCVMHTIGLVSFIALCFPTSYIDFNTKSSAAWTIASISIVCSCASLCVCMLLYMVASLRQLSLCLSMHVTMQLLHSQGFLMEKDASVPIYMPMWVARGVNIAQGMVLCYIAHSVGSISEFDTSQFYMCHVWALVVAQVIKQFIMGPIMLLVAMTVSTKVKYA